jgi:thioesterase domain-containing protein
MSTLLERQSGDVAMLVMLDTTVGERYWPLPVWLKVMALRAGKTVTSLGRLSIKSWPSYFIDRLGAMRQRIQLRGTILGSIGSTPSDTANHRPDHITQVRQAALRAMSLYLPRAPVNSMLLIRAQHRNPPLYDALPLWKSLAKNFRCHVVPCDHFSLIAQPYVQEVAASISQVLTEFRPA